jgi:membrane protease YdiL (CAAX protease family)
MIAAVVISTALFALLHDRWIVAAIAGLVFAGLAWRSRNITDAILAHGVANGLIALFAFATGAWHIL